MTARRLDSRIKVYGFLFLILTSPLVAVVTNMIPSFLISEANAASPPSPSAWMGIEPMMNRAPVGGGINFNIGVDATDLYAWEFKLGWNASLLNFVDVQPLKDLFDGFFTWTLFEDQAGIDYVMVGSVLTSTPGVDGYGPVAKIFLSNEAENVPGACLLDLFETNLRNSNAPPFNRIWNIPDDGYFATEGTPIMYVIPENNLYNPKEEFVTVVSIDGVTNLGAWQFKLGWTPGELLTPKTIDDLGFIAGQSVRHLYTSKAFFGYVAVADTLAADPGNPPGGVNGTGPLASITFNVTATGPAGNCTLNLYEVKLVNQTSGTQMPVVAFSGYFSTTVPRPTFTFEPSTYAPAVGQTIVFDASTSYDPDGGNATYPKGIVEYLWDFNDGTVETPSVPSAPTITHVYAENKTYYVTLTLTDNEGEQWTSGAKPVTVVIRDIAITNMVFDPTGSVKAGAVVNIDVTAKNEGSGEEKVSVTAYYSNATFNQAIGSNSTILAAWPYPVISKTLRIQWDTTSVSPGVYNITARVFTDPGENDPSDNERIAGSLAISTINKLTFPVTVYNAVFKVLLETDSDLEPEPGYLFDYAGKQIRLNVTGLTGSTAYVNITIPQRLLNATPTTAWSVQMNDTIISYTLIQNSTHSSIYFTYMFNSAYVVQINGTTVPLPPQPQLTTSKPRAVKNEQITLDASLSTDPDNNVPFTYTWNITRRSGSTINIIWNATTSVPSVTVKFNSTALMPYPFNITLVVQDSWGLQNSTYLLYEVFTPFDVAVVGITVPSTVNIGQEVSVNATVRSKLDVGGVLIDMNATLYVNGIRRVSQITAAPPFGTDKNVEFKWNTTGLAVGTYTLNVTIRVIGVGGTSTLPDEVDTSDNSAVLDVEATKLGSTLTLIVSPSTLNLGSTATITGSLDPVRSGAQVIIQYKVGTAAWVNITQVPTGTNGQYIYSWQPSTPAAYQLRATWLGDAVTSGNSSAIKTLTVNKQASSVSISVDPSSVAAGSKVTIGGTVTPTRSGITVTIEYRKTGEEWTELATTTTNAASGYTYEWSTSEAGTFEIRASWIGDAAAMSSVSDVATVEVKTAGLDTTLIIAGVAIAIVVIVAIVFFLRARKKS